MLAQTDPSTSLKSSQAEVSSATTHLPSLTAVATSIQQQTLPLSPIAENHHQLASLNEVDSGGAVEVSNSSERRSGKLGGSLEEPEVLFAGANPSSRSSSQQEKGNDSVGGSGGRKRSRKQQINTDTIRQGATASEVNPDLDSSSEQKGKGRKRKSNIKGRTSADGSATVKIPRAKKPKKEVEGETPIKISAVRSVNSVDAPIKRANKAKTNSKKVKVSPQKQSGSTLSLQKKISLKRSELIYPRLSFTSFIDPSRSILAIGPSQLILSAETIIEPGKESDCVKISGEDDAANNSSLVKEGKPLDFEETVFFSDCLETPHYVPLIYIYSGSAPFTRVLRFSALEVYSSVRQNQRVKNCGSKTFLCHAGRPVLQSRSSRVARKGYSRNTIVIKHPVLDFFSLKPSILKFLVLKKIHIHGKIVAVAKAKIFELRRSEDRNNVQIKIKQSSIAVKPCDVNAMNQQQNIQPVIYTDAGLIPQLQLNRILQHPQQQQYHHNIQTNSLSQVHGNQQIQQHQLDQEQQPHFEYLHYTHETATDLVYDPNPSPSSSALVAVTDVNDQQQLDFNLEPTLDPHSYVLTPASLGNSPSTAVLLKDSSGQYVLYKPESQSVLNPTSYRQQQPPQIQLIQRRQNVLPPLNIVGQGQSQNQHVIFVQQGQAQHQSQAPVHFSNQSQQGHHSQLLCLDNIASPSSSYQVLLQPSTNSQLSHQLREGQQINEQRFIIQEVKGATSVINQSQPQVQVIQAGGGSGGVVQHQYIHQQPQPSPNSQQIIQPASVISKVPVQVQQQQPSIQNAPTSQQIHLPQQTQQQYQVIQQKQSYASVIQRSQPPTQSPLQYPVASTLNATSIPAGSFVQKGDHNQYNTNTAITATPTPKSVKPKGKSKKKDKVQQQLVELSYPSGLIVDGIRVNAYVNKSNFQSGGDVQVIAPPADASTKKRKSVKKSKQTSNPQLLTTPVSSLPTVAGTSLAAKIQTESSVPPHVVITGSPGSSSPTKRIIICQQSSSSSSPPKVGVTGTSTSASVQKGSTSSSVQAQEAISNKPTRKEGYVAVCTHCGFTSINIAKCGRCSVEFGESVRLIRDPWSVDTNKIVVAANSTAIAPLAQAADITSTTSISSESDKKDKTAASASANKTKLTTSTVKKKINLVSKPAILTNQVGPSPGILQVKIDAADGSGSTVKYISSFITPVNSGTAVRSPVIKGTPKTTTPVAKKRAAPRRKKTQECITLSSDEEEPEPPKNVETATTTTTATAEVTENSVSANNSNGITNEAVTSQTPVNSNKSETTAVGLSSPPEYNEMARRMNKSMSINLNTTEPDSSKTDDPTLTSEELYELVERSKKDPVLKFQYSRIECRSIRIGSYKVTSTDAGTSLSVTVSEHGVSFKLPHSTMRRTSKAICIPMEKILNLQAYFQKRLPVMFLKTGPKFANELREMLGMDGKAGNDNSNYYCPLHGNATQQAITFLAELVSEADAGMVKKIFGPLMTEIDYDTANRYLMDVTPVSFKNSTDYKPEPDADSPAQPLKRPPTQGSLASSCDPPRSAAQSVMPLASRSTSTTNQNYDANADESIYCYEGKSTKITISPKDISCLGFEEFLNDQIIDFWLAVIQNEILSEEERKRTFVYDSFFYSKLTEKKRKVAEDGEMTAAERRHARVKKRTKNVDIFEKDFLFIPINENYHWFLAVICFPGMVGYHDYETLEPLPNYTPTTTKRAKLSASEKATKKPIVSKQPQNDTTAAYSNRDEAPEDPEEAEELNRTPEATESEEMETVEKKTEAVNEPGVKTYGGSSGALKRKASTSLTSDQPQPRVKHPCILIFDSLVSEHARIYATLREYLKIEYKTKKNEERLFDKAKIPGCMPKCPQQRNFSDCGLFMLQYIESMFSAPISTYDVNGINLRDWFDPAIAEIDKRIQIFNFIKKKMEEKCPQNLNRIPPVNFEERPENADDCRYLDEEDEDFDDFSSEFDEEEEEDYDDLSNEEYLQMLNEQRSENEHEEEEEEEAQTSTTSIETAESPDHNYATASNKQRPTGDVNKSTTYKNKMKGTGAGANVSVPPTTLSTSSSSVMSAPATTKTPARNSVVVSLSPTKSDIAKKS